MKPLLIIPPCPNRWHALSDLLAHEAPPQLDNLEKRFATGIPDTQDALAIIPDGGRILACAALLKKNSTAVLAHVFTRPEHRRRGHARGLLQTLLSWFDMVGGKRIYLGVEPALAESIFARIGFTALHRDDAASPNRIMIIRAAAGEPDNPYETLDAGPRGIAELSLAPVESTGASNESAPTKLVAAPAHPAPGPGSRDLTIREATRADWPLMVELLQYRAGPDPRIALDESAVSAELTTLELLGQQNRGTCKLLGAFHGPRMLALASLATDPLGQRTYAMQLPHGAPLPRLREAVILLANSKGYTQVDFPLEALMPQTT